MQATQRHDAIDVIEQLNTAPYRFQFTQAVRLILRRLREGGVNKEQAFRTILRFQNSLALGFPASEIETIKFVYADDARIFRRVTFTPAFIGLLGVQGVLPLHHSERFAEVQPREEDASARAFLDVFSNRMVACFYEAWGKYRVEHELDTTGCDALLPMLGALCGVSRAHLREREGSVADNVMGYYAGLLRTRPISASTVTRILSDYFDVPVAVEEFIACWDSIPANRRTTLGAPAARLGYGFTLGTRVWRGDLRVRLRIGPLDQDSFNAFFPGGNGARALEMMLGTLAIPCMQFEARLVLRRSCVRAMNLTSSDRSRYQRLGWNTFVTAASDAVAVPEVRFMLRPSSGLN